MVSMYDVFYVIATKGELRVTDIVDALHKNKEEYKSIFNQVLKLEKEKLVLRNETVRPSKDTNSIQLYRLMRFCVDNGMNYNLMLKPTMIDFIEQAARKEFFTTKDITINPRTFSFYRTALSRYGILLVISRRPVTCKLLQHSFLVNLLKYFGKKAEFYTPEKHSFMKEIKKELRKYRQSQLINYSILDDLKKRQKVDFIYSSLHLEGNPLTLPETQKLILEEILPEKHKLRHILEVTNYKRVIDLMIENTEKGVDIDLPLILEYHGSAMEYIHGAGQLRSQNVRIKGNPDFKTCPWRLIPMRIKRLMAKYREFIETKNDLAEVISFAAFFHNEYQRIHPFIDGNSRISRLLMFHILRSNDIPVLDLPIGYFDLYLDLTKRSKRRDDDAFRLMVEEMIFFSLRKLNG